MNYLIQIFKNFFETKYKIQSSKIGAFICYKIYCKNFLFWKNFPSKESEDDDFCFLFEKGIFKMGGHTFGLYFDDFESAEKSLFLLLERNKNKEKLNNIIKSRIYTKNDILMKDII